jgi:ubiquinone/menaquinone biosynthesis C-methylase UbiE
MNKSIENEWKSIYENEFSKSDDPYLQTGQSEYSFSARRNSFEAFLKKQFGKGPNINVLDVGCGPALFHEKCLRKFSGVNYTGVDYSDHFVSIALKRNPKLKILQMDARNLDIPAETMDVVLSVGMYQNLSESGAVTKEFFRVLKTGGFAYVNTLNATFFSVTNLEKHALYEAENLRAEFESAGFSQVAVERQWLWPKGLRWLTFFEILIPKGSFFDHFCHDWNVVARK